MAIATINPATGETLQTFEPLSDDAVDERIARAAAAFEGYRLTSPRQRAGWLRAAADVLDADAKSVAELMTTEMGKTLASAQAEVGKCAKALRYYAEHGEEMLQPQPADANAVGAVEAYVVHQPLGVVLAVMPWNFPLWQAMRFATPALMAGNVGLLKHASNVPQTALYLEELFRKAGFPDDVFLTLLIGSGQVEGVLRDDRVVAATLTGSNAAGQAVARVAGDVIKKTVLELGGSDPFIVMPSADLADAVDKGATVVTGGKRVDRPGWYYEPTLVTGVTPEMGIWSEEVFGPVAALHVVADLDEAIRLANDHVYGLGSNLWSEDQGERLRFIRDIQSGMAFVNGMTASYPELPFGGVKQSGYGRELTEVGMYEFCNAKTVWIGPPSSRQGEGNTAAAASE